LIVKNSLVTAMEFSRCARNRVRPTRKTDPMKLHNPSGQELHSPVSQNSTAFVEVDVVLGEPGAGRLIACHRLAWRLPE